MVLLNSFVILLFGVIMSLYRYNNHRFRNQFLPFIYFGDTVIDPEKPYSNWHETIELFWCIEGEGFLCYNADKVPIDRQTVVVVNSNVLHCADTRDGMTVRSVVIDKSFFQMNGVPVDKLYFCPSIRDPDLRDFLEQIADRYKKLDWDSFQDILTLRTLFQRMIELLCRSYLAPKPTDSHGNYVRSALEYLSQNKARRITLDEVADAVGVSKYHLAHQFKLYTQKSIMTVLMQMRLEEAWRMLRKGASISETATACGFESLPYFSTSFKKRFGITPSQCVDNKAAQYRVRGNKGIGQ